MNYNGLLLKLPKEIKFFLGSFIVVLSVGYFTGISFVNHTQGNTLKGIHENYLGNEQNPDATEMKFKKGKSEILTIVHTHILSLSLIFFLIGGILVFADLPKKLKFLLIIEPFFSILATFGGIYLMWAGMEWMTYVITVSGILMTFIFCTSVLILLYQLILRK